jgi:hypothetical protein
VDRRIKSPFQSAVPQDLEDSGAAPELPDLLPPQHDITGKVAEIPRWKKILAGFFRLSAITVPSAGAGYAAAQVQMISQAHAAPPVAAVAAHSDTGQTLDSAHIDALIPTLVIIVPQENTEIRRTETKSILREAGEFARSLPGTLLEDAVKDAVKGVAVGAPMLALGQFLKRRGRETGNKSIQWSGDAAEKIAELFGKHAPTGTITTEELTDLFGDKAPAAEILLLMSGYKKQANEWRHPE